MIIMLLFVITFYIINKFDEDPISFAWVLFYGLLLGFAASEFNADVSYEQDKIYTTKQYSSDIYSLQTISGSSGSFMLGSGVIDNNLYYYFVEKTKDNLFNISSISEKDGSKIYIKLDNPKQPYLETQITSYKYKHTVSWFYTSIFTTGETRQYILHVPTDAIQQTYSVLGGSKQQ